MRKPLNDRQAALLQRIGDDTRPVTSREPALATSVYALQHRRLVKLARSKGVWTAEITGSLLPGTRPVLAGSRRYTPTCRPSGVGRRGRLDITARELLERLQEADGRLTITNPDIATRAAWRRAIYQALNDDLVPDGKQLRHTGRDHGDLVLRSLISRRAACPGPLTCRRFPYQSS
jgi:hypothetical protein